ncbi:hypothetical protein FQR65_LT13061 [Abscondita terminalis]|nr:hypothetical protein FQR65_LT13061 [Abscondita terminalis]
MSLTLLFAFIFSVHTMGAYADSPDLLTNLKIKGEECIKEGNVNKELVDALYMNGVFAEDKSLKCFLHCLHLKLKFINDNGVVNIDEIKSQMLPLADDVAKSTVMIEGCAKIKESDGCETAFKMSYGRLIVFIIILL